MRRPDGRSAGRTSRAIEPGAPRRESSSAPTAADVLAAILPKGIPDPLWRTAWSLRRRAGLSPTQDVFRELRRRGVPTGDVAAVEVFAGNGFCHTLDYLASVKSLEAWELSPAHEADLRHNLPGATIRITDSFEEINRTVRRFGIVVVDNTITTFGPGYVEHFDLFPDLFRIAENPCVLLLNVCPKVPAALRDDTRRMSRRAAFYGTPRPHDVPIDRMVQTYATLMFDHGFLIDWSFARRRAYRTGIYYLVMRMSRPAASVTSDS
jgi:hypothetical protein